MKNLKSHTTDQLLKDLQVFGVKLDSFTFQTLAEKYDSPEEMSYRLIGNQEPNPYVCILVFEIWKRLLPEKRSLSIFCDEFEHLISLYHEGQRTHFNDLMDGLAYMQYILDQSVDEGANPVAAFHTLQSYCSTDLETFLFSFMLDQINEGDASYAKELLEGFSRYMSQTARFKYLAIRIEIEEDPNEGFTKLEEFLAKLDPQTPKKFVDEILSFLAESGNHSLFYEFTQKTIAWIREEVDFKILLEICYNHYKALDLQQPALMIAKLFEKRGSVPKETPFSQNDPDLDSLKKILNQKLIV